MYNYTEADNLPQKIFYCLRREIIMKKPKAKSHTLVEEKIGTSTSIGDSCCGKKMSVIRIYAQCNSCGGKEEVDTILRCETCKTEKVWVGDFCCG